MYLLSHQTDLKTCLLETSSFEPAQPGSLTEVVRFLSQQEPQAICWDLGYHFEGESPLSVLLHLNAVSHLAVIVVVGTPEQIAALPDAALPYISYLLEWPCSPFKLKHLYMHLNRQQELSQEINSTQHRLLQLLTENRGLRQQTQLQQIDQQTGLLNRHGFLMALEKEWRRAHRHAYPISALHIACQTKNTDQLIDLSNQLNAVRLGDCVGRYSEHDFMILLPMTFREGAEAFSAHLKHRLMRLLALSDADAQLTIQSQTEIPQSHQDSEQFLAAFFDVSVKLELLSLSV